MPTSRPQSLSSPSVKRQRQTNRTSPPLPILKNTKKPSIEAITAYWDNLSKVTFSKGALKEFDRRTPRPSRISFDSQLGLGSGKTSELSSQLERACRRGGLDLQSLRGVR